MSRSLEHDCSGRMVPTKVQACRSCIRLGTTEITVRIEGGRCTLVVTEGPDKAGTHVPRGFVLVAAWCTLLRKEPIEVVPYVCWQDVSAVVPPVGVFIGREAGPPVSQVFSSHMFRWAWMGRVATDSASEIHRFLPSTVKSSSEGWTCAIVANGCQI